MKKYLLLLLVAVFLLCSCGCGGGERVYALSDDTPVPPNKEWEKIWVIEGRETDLTLETELAVLEGSCQVNYLGQEPVEDVYIAMGSPLTSELVGMQMTREYGTVNPGDLLEYQGYAECLGWSEDVPLYVFANKLTEDYKDNYYVEISWRAGEKQYSERFFKWRPEVNVPEEH